MKNGWFLILFLGALVLNFSCSRGSGCGDIDYQGNQIDKIKQMVVEISCSDSIFFNYDFTFYSLEPKIAIRDNFFSIQHMYPSYYEKRKFGLIPLPADRNEWKILVKHKLNGNDTISIKYTVNSYYSEDSQCSGPYFFNRAIVTECKSTGSLFDIDYFRTIY
jgi:hypothetical protein